MTTPRNKIAVQARATIRLCARVLSKTMTDKELASLLDELLCCDANADLTDNEAIVGEELFDMLSDLRSDIVEKILEI